MTNITADRERQRFEHLVLGRPRPAPELPSKPKGVSKQEWKLEKERLRAAGQRLAAGVEEWVSLRERWLYKNAGTAETHEHAEQARQRPGSLARLYASGAIDKDQLAAADEIAEAYCSITADVSIRTASLEARVDGGAHGRAEHEALGRVQADFAYDWWRARVEPRVEALLAVIVHDVGLTIVARWLGMSMPRARRLLTDALDLWWTGRGRTKSAAIAAAGSQT